MTYTLKQVDIVMGQHTWTPMVTTNQKHRTDPQKPKSIKPKAKSILPKKIKPQKERRNEQRTTKTTGKQELKWQ